MDRRQIIAFRMNQHHLSKRLPRSKLEVVAASGILSGLGAMPEIAFSARIDSFRSSDLEEALRNRKSLVELSGPRAAGWIVPTEDLDIFTLGAAPQTEEDIAKFLGSARSHLAANGVFPKLALEQVVKTARAALKGRALTQDEIHEEWRKRLSRDYLYYCKGCKSWHVHWMLVGAAGLHQAFCYGPIRDGDSTFVRIEDWLPKSRKKLNPDQAARLLALRYLHFYGPSTCTDFGAWAGLSARQAQDTWALIEDELIQVNLGNGAKSKPAWIHKKDSKALASPGQARSVRLLPPRDPYLDLRDRETLIPDLKLQKQVWRIIGNPGVLLVDGEIAGTWRGKKKGRVFELEIEPLKAIPVSTRKAIENEAMLIAPNKDAETARARVI